LHHRRKRRRAVTGSDDPAASSRAAAQPSFVRSIFAYFRGWRYEAKGVVLCFLSMYLGWIMLAGGSASAMAATAATLAATCNLLAIFLINDAADRDIDCVVHPDRPIPRGDSDWKHVYAFGVFLLLAAAAFAFLVNVQFFAASLLMMLSTVLYYGYFKRRLRLLFSDLVMPMISALFPLTAFCVAAEWRLDLAMAVIAFIYFADVAHDLVGGIHDREGDRQHNIRTVAITFGDRSALLISGGSFLAALAAGAMVYVLGRLGWLYLAVFAAFSAVMLHQYLRLLSTRRDSLCEAAEKANHLGGLYFFVVSGAILPDILLRRWLG
jgi:4-hydroxybenzoate polyprenyltransferase